VRSSHRNFKPLNPAFREIAARLAMRRRLSGLSQAELAGKVGISKPQLASVESFRVALKFWVGWRCCEVLDIAPLWLASGRGDDRPFARIYQPGPQEAMNFIPPDCIFTEAAVGCVYAVNAPAGLYYSPSDEPRSVRVDFGRLFELLRAATEKPDDAARLAAFLDVPVSRVADLVSGRDLPRDATGLRMRSWMIQEHLTQQSQSATAPEKQPLTQHSANAITAPVQSAMHNLRDRLNRATRRHGMKSALARFLGVPQPCVSDWLSGKREPGGETTLRLLRWVEQQERQQQSAGDDEHTASAKTQKRKTTDEIPKANPRAG